MRAKVIASPSLSGMSVIAFAIMFLICSAQRLAAQEAESAATPLEELQKQAAAGDVPAMYALGQRYRYGRATKMDFRKAVEWYGKATQKDHAAAMTQLGRMYLAGCIWPGEAWERTTCRRSTASARRQSSATPPQ